MTSDIGPILMAADTAYPESNSGPPPVLQVAPELLAPAGDIECAVAAVENGADAVYFGLERGFNARQRATNLSLDNLPELMQLLHGRDVKGYLTLNTLVFSDELVEFEQIVRQIAEVGVDAVLVQDFGVARLIRHVAPDLPLHASTQMTLTSAECIEAVRDLGIDRVVLARELSLEEIRQIRAATTMPLETFVHGALCVAYSGQCMTSESLGGRSANRGQCAQACRLPYELICDGQDVDLGPVQYLLSPQDLAAIDLIPQLIEAGVCSLKIEGRLKTPEYVANVTRHYRQAIDAAMAQRHFQLSPREREELELSFSRGFSPGWLHGCDHKMLVPGLSSAKRGVLLGHVCRITGHRVQIELRTMLQPGDGVVFAGNRTRQPEQGGRVFQISQGQRLFSGPVVPAQLDDTRVYVAFGHDALDVRQLYPGQEVWKTDDPQLTKRLRQSFTGGRGRRRIPLQIHVRAVVGQPLRVTATTPKGLCRSVESPLPLDQAHHRPASADLFQQQLSRLGHTHYEIGSLQCEIAGRPMVPLSVLGQVRRELIAQLDALLTRLAPRRILPQAALPELRPHRTTGGPALPRVAPGPAAAGRPDGRDDARLHLLCRSLAQLDAVLSLGCRSVMVDFQDIRQYRQAAERVRHLDVELWLATPRIQKPDETGLFRAMARHLSLDNSRPASASAGFLVRNLAAVSYCQRERIPMVGDFSLNVANELTARYFHEKGLRRVTISYDLNREQVEALVAVTPPEWLELVIHQNMPLFHMEHCVFCAVMSPGTNKTNCGRPCDLHDVQLRDHIGSQHPLLADVGCRNTLFNAVPQSAAEVVPALQAQGLRDFRIEFLPQAGTDQCREIVLLYRQLLAQAVTGREVWTRLQAANRVGVTRGTLEERRNPLAIL